jgi:hypothetical protein
VHDGWQVYSQFQKALHQSCLSHPIRRCLDMVEMVSSAAAALPLACSPCCTRHWLCGTATRAERFHCGAFGPPPDGSKPNRSGCLDENHRTKTNQRLAKHLLHELPYLFTFLHCPHLEATNNRGERENASAGSWRDICVAAARLWAESVHPLGGPVSAGTK